jgi:hypothetical protein
MRAGVYSTVTLIKQLGGTARLTEVRNWPGSKMRYRGKLKKPNRGEVAERLNAAVC